MTNPTGGKWNREGRYIYSENGNIAVLSDPVDSLDITYRPLGIGSPKWAEAMANGELIVEAVKAYRYLLEQYGPDWRAKLEELQPGPIGRPNLNEEK